MREKTAYPERLTIGVTFLLAGVVASIYAVSLYPVIRRIHHGVAARTVAHKVTSFLRDLDT
ncbi:hypothetical protein [Actinocrispum wychmicini]|uniref:Uncharacterized protein n=1 Tax=Actinocrispum wychmicini TaxID=1213861 RepID=A0A4R2J3D1_9PSEU|nr:hypothetical protein [Actinocrispum wychmicini]TCO52991.1 hypothetical protein EV192_111185 [Actinocrispum wychmicini]